MLSPLCLQLSLPTPTVLHVYIYGGLILVGGSIYPLVGGLHVSSFWFPYCHLLHWLRSQQGHPLPAVHAISSLMEPLASGLTIRLHFRF